MSVVYNFVKYMYYKHKCFITIYVKPIVNN